MARPLVGWLLAAFAALVLGLAWGERFSPLNDTTFGATLIPSGRDAALLRVVPASSAARAGLKPGDVLKISNLSLSDRYRLMTGGSPPGTIVSVAVSSAGRQRIVSLEASNASGATRYTAAAKAIFLFTATLTLLIVATIAVRKPSIASAALVFYGAGTVTTYGVTVLLSFIPNPWFGAAAVVVNAAFGTLPVFALVPFIVRFPAHPSTKSGTVRMYAGDAIFLLAAVFFIFEALYEPLLFVSWSTLDSAVQIACGATVLVFAVLCYHDARGEERRRIAWVIAGFVTTAIASVVINLLAAAAYQGSTTARFLVDAGQLLSVALPVSLAYAILRHRVLDIGFAINRTVVYAVMTGLVVAVVSFADWLTSKLLSEQRLALAIEALVTISFGFALNWIHGRTERLIDRVVFRARHIAEKRIEYRIGALGFAESSTAVDDALAADAPLILDLASAAVFSRLTPGSPFRRSASMGWTDNAATTVDADSILVRTLRSLERPVFLDDVAIAPAMFPGGPARPTLAVPIVAQHELVGFALYGNHADGGSHDPEEVALLAKLAQAAGNAYGAVEARRWRERASALEESLQGIATAQLTR